LTHLYYCLTNVIVDREITGIFVCELSTRCDLAKNFGYLGEILTLSILYFSGDNAESLWGKKGRADVSREYKTTNTSGILLVGCLREMDLESHQETLRVG
jgi:hypothetical protein